MDTPARYAPAPRQIPCRPRTGWIATRLVQTHAAAPSTRIWTSAWLAPLAVIALLALPASVWPEGGRLEAQSTATMLDRGESVRLGSATVTVPPSLTPVSSAGGGEDRAWRSADGELRATIGIEVGAGALREQFAQARERLRELTYTRLREDQGWYVATGRDGSVDRYERALVWGDSTARLVITAPRGRLAAHEGVITVMSRSLVRTLATTADRSAPSAIPAAGAPDASATAAGTPTGVPTDGDRSGCQPYNAPVTLTGRLALDTVSSEGTAPSVIRVLRLPVALCTRPSGLQDDPDNQAAQGVTAIQLAYSGGPIGTLAGDSARVTGTLFHSFTAHHRTEVLMLVSAIKPYGLTSPEATPGERVSVAAPTPARDPAPSATVVGAGPTTQGGVLAAVAAAVVAALALVLALSAVRRRTARAAAGSLASRAVAPAHGAMHREILAGSASRAPAAATNAASSTVVPTALDSPLEVREPGLPPNAHPLPTPPLAATDVDPWMPLGAGHDVARSAGERAYFLVGADSATQGPLSRRTLELLRRQGDITDATLVRGAEQADPVRYGVLFGIAPAAAPHAGYWRAGVPRGGVIAAGMLAACVFVWMALPVAPAPSAASVPEASAPLPLPRLAPECQLTTEEGRAYANGTLTARFAVSTSDQDAVAEQLNGSIWRLAQGCQGAQRLVYEIVVSGRDRYGNPTTRVAGRRTFTGLDEVRRYRTPADYGSGPPSDHAVTGAMVLLDVACVYGDPDLRVACVSRD